MKVLLSAYACEPGKGSEPGVGWTWVCGLAGQVQLTVLTRSNNRDPIEAEIASLPHDHPLHGVRFLYHDLPASIRRLKSAGLCPRCLTTFSGNGRPHAASRVKRTLRTSSTTLPSARLCARDSGIGRRRRA